MLTFAEPWFLLLLVLVPPLVVWWLRRGERALRYPATALVQGLPSGRADGVVRARAGLRVLGLCLLIVALAGPRWPDPGTRIPTRGIAIAMVVDVSRSMANQDFLWEGEPISRLDAVKRTFRLLVEGGAGLDGRQLEGRPQDLIALVTYATRPETACPLTLNHGVLLQILDRQEPRTLTTEATTNTGDAIAWALHSLQTADSKRKVIILLTDGEHNVPAPALDPIQSAQLAGNLHVPIYTIQAGNEIDDTGKPTDEAVRAAGRLQKVAQMTDGQYFRADDSAGLLDVYARIDRLERDEIRSFQYRRYFEGFAWVGLAALVVWMALHVLEATLWRKIP